MNKNIKLLVESFFDDDIFSENTLDDNLEDLGRYYKLDDLYQCKSIDDIRVYIDDTYNIKEKLIYIINNFEDILSHNKINNEYINKINSSSVRLALPLSDNFKYKNVFNLQIEKYKGSDVIYRNKPYNGDMKVIILNSEYMNCGFLTDYKYNYSLDYLNYEPNNINKKLETILINYNNKLISENIDNYTNIIIDNIFNTKKLLEEILHKGKVYPVVQKDIDRMTKCLNTHQFSGFDKITKPEKMVARLAALFIVYNKSKGIDNIKILDKTLFDIVNKKIYKSNYLNTYSDDGIFLFLGKINDFPTIHINDVIETYNAYKDKF